MARDDEADDEAEGRWGKDEPQFDLTPEQAESLRRTVASFQRALGDVSGSLNIQRENLIRGFQPILDAQRRVSQLVTSDGLKRLVKIQLRFAEVASQLGRTIDFGFEESAAKILASFAEQQSALVQNIVPALTAIRTGFYPPNLRAIERLEFEAIEQVVMVDGIPLYGLPRTSTAAALMRADDLRERRNILGRRWRSISADCRSALTACSGAFTAPYVRFAVDAVDALDNGHVEAAQALAGSLIDTVVAAYFGKERTKYTPHPNGKRTTDAYDELTIRDFIAFAPIWQAYQQFTPGNGNKVPRTFSRHATVHAVCSRQYSKRNAIQSVMLACSLLRRIDEKTIAAE